MSAAILLDALREKFKIKTDAALARELEFTPGEISKLRSGRREVGARLLLSVYEHLGVEPKDARLMAEQSASQQYHDSPAPVS